MDFKISMMRKNSQMRIISRSKRPPAAYLLVAVERASTLFSILAFHHQLGEAPGPGDRCGSDRNPGTLTWLEEWGAGDRTIYIRAQPCWRSRAVVVVTLTCPGSLLGDGVTRLSGIRYLSTCWYSACADEIFIISCLFVYDVSFHLNYALNLHPIKNCKQPL